MEIQDGPRNNAFTLNTESHYMKVLNQRVPSKDGNRKRVPEFFGDTFAGNRQCLKIEYLE